MNIFFFFPVVMSLLCCVLMMAGVLCVQGRLLYINVRGVETGKFLFFLIHIFVTLLRCYYTDDRYICLKLLYGNFSLLKIINTRLTSMIIAYNKTKATDPTPRRHSDLFVFSALSSMPGSPMILVF